MIAKELQYRFKHYALLIGILSVLFAIYVFSSSLLLRGSVSVFIGGVYMLWGLWSHKGEIRTPRLVLEYVAVGILGSLILGILAYTV